jgi:glycosyltransferase 2 family protein
MSARPSPQATGLAAPTVKTNRLWYLVATILLSATLLCLAVRGVKWREFATTIRHARLGLLLAAFGIYHVSMALRSLRWRVLLSAEKKVAPLTVFWATMAGYLGNNFLPARAGEVIRSAALGHRTGLSKSWVLATALTERLLDVVALVLFSFAAVLSLGRSSQWLVRAWKLMGVVGIAGIILLLAVPRFEGRFRRLLERLPNPTRLRERLLGVLAQFLSGMRAFANPSRGFAFAGMTVLIWLTDAFGTIILTRSFGLNVTLPVAVMVLAGLGLSSAIPSTPGYVGVYQFAAVAVLVPLGYPRTDVLAYIVAAQALGYMVVTIWGLLGLWRLQVSPAGLRWPLGAERG